MSYYAHQHILLQRAASELIREQSLVSNRRIPKEQHLHREKDRRTAGRRSSPSMVSACSGADRITKFAKLQRLPCSEELSLLSTYKKKQPVAPLRSDVLGVRDPVKTRGLSLYERRMLINPTRTYQNSQHRHVSDPPAAPRYKTGHSVWGIKKYKNKPNPSNHPTQHQKHSSKRKLIG